MRSILAKDPFMLKDNVNAVHKYLDSQIFWSPHSSLMKSDTQCPEKADKVDKILFNASLLGEKACTHRNTVGGLFL
eukprot:13896932-Ditylum_brightwellii.AAC.1